MIIILKIIFLKIITLGARKTDYNLVWNIKVSLKVGTDIGSQVQFSEYVLLINLLDIIPYSGRSTQTRGSP